MAVHSLGTLYSLSAWRHSLADSPSFRTQSDLRMHSANSARISLQLDGIVNGESCVMQKKERSEMHVRDVFLFTPSLGKGEYVTVKSKIELVAEQKRKKVGKVCFHLTFFYTPFIGSPVHGLDTSIPGRNSIPSHQGT